MGQKRKYDDGVMRDSAHLEGDMPSYTSIFESFREDLDEHHDRRQRIIKASKDITAASKKIIFALQRARNVGRPVPDDIAKASAPCYKVIADQYAGIVTGLQGINAYRYERIASGGHQELIEAISFEHYLTTQELIPYHTVCDRFGQYGGSEGLIVPSVEDYLLGIYDMTGELMRFCITSIATTGSLPSDGDKMTSAWTGCATDIDKNNDRANGRTRSTDQHLRDATVLQDLRELRGCLEGLDTRTCAPAFASDVERKMVVMQTSVEKVEKATYGLVVRGSQRLQDRSTAEEMMVV